MAFGFEKGVELPRTWALPDMPGADSLGRSLKPHQSSLH